MILYKYLPPERVDVLQNRAIRFSQPDALNDAYEASVVFESMIPSECVPRLIAHMDETGELDSALSEGVERGIGEALQVLEALGLPDDIFDREALRAFALQEFEKLGGKAYVSDMAAQVFTEATGPGNPAATAVLAERYREAINEYVGVLCLSESWDALKMWSLYAESHGGVVLGFDGEDHYFRQPYVTLMPTGIRPVTYSDEIPKFEGFDPLGAPEQLLRLGDPFFFKGPEWAEEREWRLLRPLGSATTVISAEPHPVHLMRFPDHVLKEVVVGAKATSATRSAVEIAVAASHLDHVAVYDARLTERRRSVERTLVRAASADPFWIGRV